MPDPATYYDVLAVSKTATTAEIKAAWKKLAKVYHPDLLGDVEPAVRQVSEAKFKEISEAYKVLSNPARRTTYDERWKPAGESASQPPARTADPSETWKSYKRRPVQRKGITPRAKALAVLTAVVLSACWLIAYFVISAGAPNNMVRTPPPRKSAAAEARAAANRAAANNVTRDGCLHSANCIPYRFLAYDEKLESKDGHAGLYIIEWPGGQLTAYCEDASQNGEVSGGCSKFAGATGKTIWLDNAQGSPCYELDQELWTDQEGGYHQGHVQCLTVVGRRDLHMGPTRSYQELVFHPNGDGTDKHKDVFLLESKDEMLRAYCESGSAWDAVNPCSKLARMVGQKVSLTVSAPDRNSLCFDEGSSWRMDQHGEYHLENRECLRVVERRFSR